MIRAEAERVLVVGLELFTFGPISIHFSCDVMMPALMNNEFISEFDLEISVFFCFVEWIYSPPHLLWVSVVIIYS